MNEHYRTGALRFDPVRSAELAMHEARRALEEAKRWYETCEARYRAVAQPENK